MKLVGATLSHHVDYRAGVATILGVESIGDDAELLNAIGRRLNNRQIGELIVTVSTVNAIVVGPATSAIYRNHSWLVAAVEQVRPKLRLYPRL